MNECKITDEMQKMLTEFLGEYWHDYIINGNELSKCSCGMTGCNVREVCSKENRTFTSDTDMLAVFRKIRDVGKLEEFYYFFVKKLAPSSADRIVQGVSIIPFAFTEWLFLDNPERACVLAAMFLEVRE